MSDVDGLDQTTRFFSLRLPPKRSTHFKDCAQRKRAESFFLEPQVSNPNPSSEVKTPLDPPKQKLTRGTPREKNKKRTLHQRAEQAPPKLISVSNFPLLSLVFNRATWLDDRRIRKDAQLEPTQEIKHTRGKKTKVFLHQIRKKAEST